MKNNFHMSINAKSGIRLSHYLSIRFINGKFLCMNELVGELRQLPIIILEFFTTEKIYDSKQHINNEFQKIFPESTNVEAAVSTLIETGIYIVIGSELDLRETEFSKWVWGKSTRAHFLATRRIKWLGEDEEEKFFRELLCTEAIPNLWLDLLGEEDEWRPLGISVDAKDAFCLFEQRRSLRQFSTRAIQSEELGAILSAGLGINQFLSLPLRPTFPLRFTPSPGGLNCFSGYILIKHVIGFDTGVYLYNALRNQIKKIDNIPIYSISELFGNQAWADEAAIIIILCANYEKMSLKYKDASAFNSLLIEAGHIAQNMLICASSIQIGGVPTNAIDQNQLEKHLNIQFPKQASVYAIAFGYPDEHCV